MKFRTPKSRHCKAVHVGSSLSSQHRELTAPVSSVVFMLPSMTMRPQNIFIMTHCKKSPCAARGMLINAADRRREGLSCMVDRNIVRSNNNYVRSLSLIVWLVCGAMHSIRIRIRVIFWLCFSLEYLECHLAM